MKKSEYPTITVTAEKIESIIHEIRGQRVILDQDLALLYDVPTKRLKEQVRRNIERFPGDFMFELNKLEAESLRSQIASSKVGSGGNRYMPMAFTEHGVLMLSSVLNSEKAILINIHIMRVYTKMKELLVSQKAILLKLEKIQRKVGRSDQDVANIFACLKELLNEPKKESRKIGYLR